jgi:tetraacyldisaccharide 4'-kinase
MGFSMIRNAVQRFMARGDVASPAFSSPWEWGLYACSQVYQLATKLRLRLYEKGILKNRSLPCKVVSIGNITVGGTGKTPMVHYVASLLKGLGLEVAVISRGYGGYAQRSGGVVSNGKTIFMGLRASGNEPQLLASKLTGIPLLIGKDRHRVGRQAIGNFGVSVLVLDDAFQHLRLKRDLDLLLLDSLQPFGNGHCIPRGTLREPVEQIKRASALILTRWPWGDDLARVSPIIELARGRPVFRCVHFPDGLFTARQKESLDLKTLKGQKLFLFSGIARNDSFRETVSRLGGDIAGSLSFPDHHRYSHKDIQRIWKRAEAVRAENVMTTEKDYFNIQMQIPSVPPLMVLTISISFQDDAEAFESYLKTQIMATMTNGLPAA